jgi:hypothetical protein
VLDHQVLITSRFRTLDILLEEITLKLDPKFGAIRKVWAPRAPFLPRWPRRPFLLRAHPHA